MADWGRKLDGRGLGFAYINYSDSLLGGIAEVSVDRKTGVISVHHFWCALDCGIEVHPDNEPDDEVQLNGRYPVNSQHPIVMKIALLHTAPVERHLPYSALLSKRLVAEHGKGRHTDSTECLLFPCPGYGFRELSHHGSEVQVERRIHLVGERICVGCHDLTHD